MAASSGLFLARIYNQSQLAERKHVACYWLIDTAATAVPLIPHPCAITKLAAAILGGGLFGGSVLLARYCPCVYDHLISLSLCSADVVVLLNFCWSVFNTVRISGLRPFSAVVLQSSFLLLIFVTSVVVVSAKP